MNIRLVILAFIIAALLSIGAAFRDYFVGDLFLASAVQEVRAGLWEETMEVVTLLGQTPYLLAFVLALVAWSLWRRRKAECLAVIAVVPTFGISLMLKSLVERPRPTEDLVSVWRGHEGFSFPSGHAFNIVVVFGLLFYLAPFLLPWRWAVHLVRISSLSMIALVGTSRVYLGAHWPSDVLGGFLFGAIVLALLIYLHRLQSSQRGLPQAA